MLDEGSIPMDGTDWCVDVVVVGDGRVVRRPVEVAGKE